MPMGVHHNFFLIYNKNYRLFQQKTQTITTNNNQAAGGVGWWRIQRRAAQPTAGHDRWADDKRFPLLLQAAGALKS
jgi:hypothetical protein